MSESIRPPRPAVRKHAFRPDIEGLRAIAIALVVAFHAGLPGAAGGFVGVDVFFALSGYLITRLLLVEYAENGRIQLLAFYARRARRLLPAMAVVLLVTIAVGSIIYSPIEQAQLAKTALATAVYASNLYFAKRATNYWDAGTGGDPLLHTWSLSVEEQFYFLWPPLLLAVFWFGRKLHVRALPRFAFLVTVSFVLLSFALAIFLTSYIQPYAFFLPVSRAWEFGAGSLLAMLPWKGRAERAAETEKSGRGGDRIWPTLLICLGLMAIFVAALTYDHSTTFPGFAALLPVVGTLLVLRAGETKRSPTRVDRWGLHHPAMQFLGKISYSWYLWHWPVLAFGEYIFGKPTLLTGSLAVIASLGVAMLSYHWVESPIRYSRRMQGQHLRALGAAAGITVVSIASALSWMTYGRYLLGTDDQRAIAAARDDLPVVYGMKGCIAEARDSSITGCTFGDDRADVRAVLVGDSHADAWFPAVHEIARERFWHLTVFTKTQCPMADVSFVIGEVGREYFECTLWRERVVERIRALQPDIVVVSNAQGYTLGEHPAVRPEAWVDGFERTLSMLSEAGRRVVVLRDTPYIGFDVPTCLSRERWAGPGKETACFADARMAYQAELFSREVAVASKFSNVTMTDVSGEFCRDGLCPAVIDGRIAFRDSNHMTASFAVRLKPLLAADLFAPLEMQTTVEAP